MTHRPRGWLPSALQIIHLPPAPHYQQANPSVASTNLEAFNAQGGGGGSRPPFTAGPPPSPQGEGETRLLWSFPPRMAPISSLERSRPRSRTQNCACVTTARAIKDAFKPLPAQLGSSFPKHPHHGRLLPSWFIQSGVSRCETPPPPHESQRCSCCHAALAYVPARTGKPVPLGGRNYRSLLRQLLGN